MILQTRRLFTKRLIGAALNREKRLLSVAPDMLSAGYIARRGDRVRRRIDGVAIHAGDRRGAFRYDQPFRVASVSKMITAAIFMPLVAQGRISLDADISSYLGAPLRHPAFPNIPITPRMLLSHTSGVRNGDDYPVPFNRSLLAHLIAAAREERFGGWWSPASEAPGVWFAYSDTNFALIAQIIECVTQRRFDQYAEDALFAPLGLDIGYNWSGVSQRKRDRSAAAARWLNGAWTTQVDADPPRAPEVALYRGDSDSTATESDYRIGGNGFAFAPHGGLRLSLTDMDRLARFLLAESDLVAPMAQAAWTYAPDAPNGATETGFYQAYGLGMQTPVGRNGADAYFGADTAEWRGHCGDAYGWMTGLWFNARTHTTLVYAVNGMPEFNRALGRRSALAAAEEAIVDAALADLGG